MTVGMDGLVITVDGAGLDSKQERDAQLALWLHFAAAGVEPHYAAEAWFASECGSLRTKPPSLAQKLQRAAIAWRDASVVAAKTLGVDATRVKLSLTIPN
jgi:hypothetical protein